MAIINPTIGNEGDVEKMGGKVLSPLIARLWQVMVILGGLLVLIFLIWGAFDWLSSGGDEKKLEGAKDKITNAIVGMVILAGSFAIVSLLENVFGFSIINIVWPTPNAS